MTELSARLDIAIAAALKASSLIRPYFRSPSLSIEIKKDLTPVSEADKKAEQLIRREITNVFPDDGIVGEEYAEKQGKTGYRWYLDPIDGTKAFIRGVPLFGTMVAVERSGVMVAGVVAFPALSEIIYASQGHGAWFSQGVDFKKSKINNIRRAHVSKIGELKRSCICTGEPHLFVTNKTLKPFERIISSAGVVRGWSDCYAHYLVATGKIEAMVEPEMSVWDNAALLPIIQESGGKFTDFSGRATAFTRNAISSNGLVHAELLKLIKKEPR
ncbi:MAG: histidinol phosphate phosphatase [Dehalococcoidia bacterium]|nr:histidinol phosphate phosphatase [Dehalococcoidia bacterium]